MTSKEYMDSGILEKYVMGIASDSERTEVEMRVAADAEIRCEINVISDVLEQYAMSQAIPPGPIVKPFLMATIDYTERIKSGEAVSFPPALHADSKVEEYAPWLRRPELDFSGSQEDNLFAKIIGYTREMITAIVWIQEDTPLEIHDKELESFLIVEGTCNIHVGDKSTSLVPGDYFAIPLHEYHTVKVTSSIACKAILQRIAA